MKALNFLAALLLASLSLPLVLARGGEVGNGGDVVEAEFFAIARETYGRLTSSRPKNMPNIQMDTLKKVVEALTVDRTIKLVSIDGAVVAKSMSDFKDAVNYNGEFKRIEVSRERWFAIQQFAKKMLLVMHELLILSGHADLNYEISNYFLYDNELSAIVQAGAYFQMERDSGGYNGWLCYEAIIRHWLNEMNVKMPSDREISDLAQTHFAAESREVARVGNFRLQRVVPVITFLNVPHVGPYYTWNGLRYEEHSTDLGVGVYRLLTVSVPHRPEILPSKDQVNQFYLTNGIPTPCKGIVFSTPEALEQFRFGRDR